MFACDAGPQQGMMIGKITKYRRRVIVARLKFLIQDHRSAYWRLSKRLERWRPPDARTETMRNMCLAKRGNTSRCSAYRMWSK